MIMIKMSPKQIFALLLILSACIFPACKNKSKATEPEIIARTPVTAETPSYKDISDSIDLPAITAYLKRNSLRSTVTGVVESVSVVQSQSVAKGKEAFAVRTMEATAMKNSQPGDSTLGLKGLIKILTPVDGIISSVVHQTGDFVQEGDELAVVAETGSMVFMLEVPYELTGIVRINTPCLLFLPDNTRIRGRITSRFPEMDKQNQTIRFVVNAGNISKLPENLIASGLIVRNERKHVQVLPRQAVLGNETLTSFWVMKLINDSVAIKIGVRKGIENNDLVEITDPRFDPADRILVTGNYGLPDTAAVITGR